MIHLNLSGAAGGTVYLDVQEIETRRTRGEEVFLLSGTLGDGLYEGQVLVEVGAEVEITLIDEWLGDGDLGPFLQRVGRQAVKDALSEATAGILFCMASGPFSPGPMLRRVTGYGLEGRWYSLRPRSYGEQLELPLLVVAEPQPSWECQAA